MWSGPSWEMELNIFVLLQQGGGCGAARQAQEVTKEKANRKVPGAPIWLWLTSEKEPAGTQTDSFWGQFKISSVKGGEMV